MIDPKIAASRTMLFIAIVALGGCADWQYPWRRYARRTQPAGATADVGNKSKSTAPAPAIAMRDDESPATTPPPGNKPPVDDMLSRIRRAARGPGSGQSAPRAGRGTGVGDQAITTPDVAAGQPKVAAGSVQPVGHAVVPVDTGPGLDKSSQPRGTPKTSSQTVQPLQPARPVVLAVRVSERAEDETDRTAGGAADRSDGAVSRHPATVRANQGVRTQTRRKPGSLEQAVEQVRSEARSDPGSVKSQWQMSLLRLASGDSDPVDATVKQQLPADRAVLLDRAVTAAAATGSVLTDPMADKDDALDAVDKLRDVLRSDADLMIPVLTLCSRVDAFGVYEELPRSALVPGRSNQAIVYCEVANFSSKPAGDGYRTLLASRLELFTADGQSVWHEDHDRIEDFCRRRREDFFLAQLVRFPALSAGEYVLKVTITDQLSSKTNQATTRINVGQAVGIAAVSP